MKKRMALAVVLCMTVACSMCISGDVLASSGRAASAKVRNISAQSVSSKMAAKSAVKASARPMAESNTFTLDKSAVICLYPYVSGVSFSVIDKNGKQTDLTASSTADQSYSKSLTAGTYTIDTSAALSDYDYMCIYNSNRTIKTNTSELVGNVEAATRYLKIKATKTGFLIVKDYINVYDGTWGGGNIYGHVTLLNSKKKAISEKLYFSGGSDYVYQTYGVFGVTKGKTYYLKVQCGSLLDDGFYTIFAYNDAVKEKSGSKKSKAKSLTKGKYHEGTITAGSSGSDWYKFKSSKKTVKVTLIGYSSTSGKTKITVTKGKHKLSAVVMRGGGADKELSMTNWGSGTYYIQVARGASKSSGYYEVQYQ